MPTTLGILTVGSMTELKSAPTSADTTVLLLGKSTASDGFSGFYRWDPDSSATEDLTFMNAITSSLSSTGRWVRIFQRARTLPHGVLVYNGGVKSFYPLNAVTDANGEVVLNLTENNTTTGVPLFSAIWSVSMEGVTATASANDVVVGSRKALSSDSRVLTLRFVRGASTLVSVLGVALPGLRVAPAGISIGARIDGI